MTVHVAWIVYSFTGKVLEIDRWERSITPHDTREVKKNNSHGITRSPIDIAYRWVNVLQKRFREVLRCSDAGRVSRVRCKRESDTNLLVSSETTRRHVAGHRFSRAPASRVLRKVTQGERNDDERLAFRHETPLDFCLHALPTMRRGNSSVRDHATDHAREENRTSRCYHILSVFITFAFLDEIARYAWYILVTVS